jgi:hypothetical protein
MRRSHGSGHLHVKWGAYYVRWRTPDGRHHNRRVGKVRVRGESDGLTRKEAVSTPRGGSSTLRVYAWRNLRGAGAHYLQQSVCLLPATPATTRTAMKVVTRVRAEGGEGEILEIELVDPRQETRVIDAMQAERTDEYHELVESTRQFHEELEAERRRGRATYTELEESDADLARYNRWLTAIRARDYFDAPGADKATAAVASCEAALARFESDALSAELDERTSSPARSLRAVDRPDD